jgi:hypothetical protein
MVSDLRIFGAFIIKSYKMSLLAPPYLSLGPWVAYISTREWLNGFSWNLIFRNFIKICRHSPALIKIGQISGHFVRKPARVCTLVKSVTYYMFSGAKTQRKTKHTFYTQYTFTAILTVLELIKQTELLCCIIWWLVNRWTDFNKILYWRSLLVCTTCLTLFIRGINS